MTAVAGDWSAVEHPAEGATLEQRQRFDAVRLGAGVSIGLGRGFWVGAQVPVELRSVRTTWWRDAARVDGPPGMADGAEVGLGDVVVRAGWMDQPLASTVMLGPTLGVALPTGRTGPDPETLPPTAQRRRRFGGGTVDPLVGFDLFYASHDVGVWLSAGGRFPLMKDRHGYRAGVSGQLAVGPTLRPHGAPWLQAHLQGLLRAEGPERWHDRLVPEAARVSAGVGGGFVFNPTPALSVLVRGEVAAWELVGENRFRMPLNLTVAVSGLLDPPRRKAR